MTKKNISTNLDPEWIERIEALAKAGFSNPASIIRQCVMRFLPLMEQELEYNLKKRKK